MRIIYTLLLFMLSQYTGWSQVMVQRQATLMGSVFSFTVVDVDSLQAEQYIDSAILEIDRIENLISEWRPHTQVSAINRNAGIAPVRVDAELFELTRRALQYSQMSGGAFDISIAALDKVWKFDGSMTETPSEKAVRQSVAKVGYANIILDSVEQTIFLKLKGMKIGFGSIGKGYAADKGRAYLQQRGVQAGIVNASGDLATWGQQPDGKPWTVGINHPFKAHKIVKVLKMKESAAATSGSYEKYAEIAGKRYAHIINPKTGYPSTGLASVTIYGPSAEFANALSTSIMVLGKKKGKQFLQRFPTYKAVFISDKGDR